MNFNQWIKEQSKRDDPVGDFAKDVIDSDDTNQLQSASDWRTYLMRKNASQLAVKAFKQAWNEWKVSRQ